MSLSTTARAQTWEEIRSTLQRRRLAAYSAWQQWGPGTTREVAEKSGIDLLTLRPRTTELLQLGFLVETGLTAGQGIYQALTEDQAIHAWQQRQQAEKLTAHQLPLQLSTEH